MLTGDEISRSASAAVALFKGDPQGLRRLDLSYDGFWRSFQVFFLLLPLYGVLILSERSMLLQKLPVTEDTFPSQTFVVSRLIGYGLEWILFPIVLAVLARPLRLTRSYVPLVIALNWASLVASVPVVIPHLLLLLGLVSPEVAAVLELVALGFVLRYLYVVTRIATAAPPGFCIGLVALDFLTAFALSAVVQAVAGI